MANNNTKRGRPKKAQPEVKTTDRVKEHSNEVKAQAVTVGEAAKPSVQNVPEEKIETVEVTTEIPKEIGQKAIKLFKTYPAAIEIFFTSDTTAFLKKDDAKNHAQTLQDKNIITIEK